MLKLGLTGSIATGKSTVLAMFATLGVPVFSSDEAVHRLYAGEAVAPIGEAFPGAVRDGQVDRAALSAHLVAHPGDLARLEAIVHPLVRREIAAFIERTEASGAPLAVIDVPLLFETGYDYGFDAVVVTAADDTIVRQRALARPGMTVEKLATVLARQLPQAEKVRRADYVLDTSGPIRATEAAVRALVERLGRPTG
jgi:dephospho-CoA kinase